MCRNKFFDKLVLKLNERKEVFVINENLITSIDLDYSDKLDIFVNKRNNFFYNHKTNKLCFEGKMSGYSKHELCSMYHRNQKEKALIIEAFNNPNTIAVHFEELGNSRYGKLYSFAQLNSIILRTNHNKVRPKVRFIKMGDTYIPIDYSLNNRNHIFVVDMEKRLTTNKEEYNKLLDFSDRWIEFIEKNIGLN
jgi:hypothetical protein